MPQTKTYREVFNNPQPGGYYLMPLRAAEDRGGSSKATGLILADTIDKLKKVPREGPIYQVRNGALFQVGHLEGKGSGNRLPLTVVEEVKKNFDPESTGWWSLKGIDDEGESLEDDEEAVDTAKPHYVVIFSGEDYLTHKMEHRLALTHSWTKAFGALLADNGGDAIVTVYRVEPGTDGTMEAKLVSTTASVENGSREELMDEAEMGSGTATADLAQYRTGFSQYDFALNPYEGCQFACKYCYAGVYKDYADLPKDKWQGRIVIGTHTDPYQPRELRDERTYGLLLQLLAHAKQHPGKITKVGIFTRGPLIGRDLHVINKLPNPVIHFDLSPFPDDWRQKLENSAPNIDRLRVFQAIKDEGIKLILNICPCVPKLSEEALGSSLFREAYKLADEICVGLLMMYGGIPEKLKDCLPAESLELLSKSGWEDEFLGVCDNVFRPYYADKLVIWRDRTRRGWKKMEDKSLLPQEFYLE